MAELTRLTSFAASYVLFSGLAFFLTAGTPIYGLPDAFTRDFGRSVWLPTVLTVCHRHNVVPPFDAAGCRRRFQFPGDKASHLDDRPPSYGCMRSVVLGKRMMKIKGLSDYSAA